MKAEGPYCDRKSKADRALCQFYRNRNLKGGVKNNYI